MHEKTGLSTMVGPNGMQTCPFGYVYIFDEIFCTSQNDIFYLVNRLKQMNFIHQSGFQITVKFLKHAAFFESYCCLLNEPDGSPMPYAFLFFLFYSPLAKPVFLLYDF